ncbi:MAG: uroporphyrinogen-III synthase [Ginsengibacter sp.]
MQNKIQILCTKKISNSFIQHAEESNICIDELNFIETKESVSEEIKKRIVELSKLKITAIFTSSNAVQAVGKIISGEVNWKIYCVEPATKKTVKLFFKSSSISGSATDAAQLSNIIIENKPDGHIVFFCGNMRRDLLPDKLKINGIAVEELLVYQTIENAQSVSKNYKGILFFSPSAARSFFAKNKIDSETILFAIGKTTAGELKNYSNNKIIISDIPETKQLIAEVIKHFSAIKNI